MKRAGNYWVPDEEQIQLEALAKGGWQLDHLEKALRLVKKRRVAVDGGAHIGSWTLRMAETFQCVIAFEPSPETFKCLEANVREWRESHENGKCDIVLNKFALGETAGLMSMGEDSKYSDGGNTGGRYLVDKPGDINVRRLDTFGLERLDFLKLDIEGFELYALKGARETLLKFRPVIMIEEKIRIAHRYGLRATDAGEFLESLGAYHRGSFGSDHFYGWPKLPEGQRKRSNA